MSTQIRSVLGQVAARHQVSAEEVRSEIAQALAGSQADPALSPEEFIAFAALSIALSRE